MSRDFSHVRFISAGAGSGKTYRLTVELERALVHDGVRPSRVIVRRAARTISDRGSTLEARVCTLLTKPGVFSTVRRA